MVVKAVAQRVARRDLLEPNVEVRFLLADAAWPKPVDQHAIAVIRCRGLVNTLDPEARCLRVRWSFRHHWLAMGLALAPLKTISVEVPWERMRPLASMMRASADMIWRPRPMTRPSARTRPVSCLIARVKFAL